MGVETGVSGALNVGRRQPCHGPHPSIATDRDHAIGTRLGQVVRWCKRHTCRGKQYDFVGDWVVSDHEMCAGAIVPQLGVRGGNVAHLAENERGKQCTGKGAVWRATALELRVVGELN